MPSEDLTQAPSPIAIETPFIRSKEAPAPEQEFKEFWRQLRHFYRTGEKAPGENPKNLKSITWPILENLPNPYPLTLEEVPIAFGPGAPVLILQQLLWQYQQENNHRFKGKLEELVDGLKRMLSMDQGSNSMEKTYDFADEIIAFDRLSKVIGKKSTVALSSERLHRLQPVLENLSKGLDYFGDQIATIIADKEKAGLFENYTHAELVPIDRKDAFGQVQKIFNEQMQFFAALIKSYRIAQLELEDSYRMEVHDDYFAHFTWHQLSKEELTLFHPVILVSEHTYVMKHLGSFSKLIAANTPVKLLVLNDQLVSEPEKDMSWEDASRQFREELATITISHRNAFLFQSSVADVAALQEGIERALEASTPAVIHLLNANDSEMHHLHLLRGAAFGRLFPSLSYDPNQDTSWSLRFDASKNNQPAQAWPTYALNIRSEDKTEPLTAHFTYADYKALHPEKLKELMLIPSAYDHELLVPLGEYLELVEKQLYGKIPYIWLVQEDNQLVKAAVPNVWVVSCQERLDYWRFVQELGGLQSTIKQREEKNEIETDQSTLETITQQDMETIQEEALAKAAERLISALLEDEELTVLPLETSTVIEESPVESAPSVEKESPATAPAEQAWVESESCTSCNECTDKYPHIFQYNEEKQAFIPNPSKGRYEELVKAAEKCPAACIHPGMPSNSSETNLEKLIKRAEKYN